MNINIPEFATVVLIGASGSGKSTFAAKHFLPTEILSSDHYRGVICDDVNDQRSTTQAFELLHHVMGLRLNNRRSVVIDATNVQHQARKPLIDIARRHHSMLVAIVLNMPEALCQSRNEVREGRKFGKHVVRNHTRLLKRSLKHLRREGFRYVHVINTLEDLEKVCVERTPLWNNKKSLTGPFDIIGDIHGCYDELEALLTKLGHRIQHEPGSLTFEITPPSPARTVLFVGDLVDRGPKSDEVLALVMAMVEQNLALCVSGNHEAKLIKALEGRKVKIAHGLQASLDQLGARDEVFNKKALAFMNGLISHYILDGGKLCLAHAGLREDLQGRASGRVRAFALYGDTSGMLDEHGLPIRLNWAADYRGSTTVVYGHVVTPNPQWLNNTLCIDTGCVFGGKLTALRYPERELVQVDALQTYYEPDHPLVFDQTDHRHPQHEHDDLIDLHDVSGKMIIKTKLRNNIIIQADQSVPAMEVMSRFAINPKWLIHLPPTMSPTATSSKAGYLEYPEEALKDYKKWGVDEVICQVKHMGSRAIAIVTQTDQVAMDRFGQTSGRAGVIYTRTGRAFFKDAELERALLLRIREAATKANLWQTLDTQWLCLDAELMPWSAKAQGLIKSQYASVATAAHAAFTASAKALDMAIKRQPDAGALRERFEQRAQGANRLAAAYRPYCWSIDHMDDYKMAPFHLLASEGQHHADKPHLWHMDMLGKLVDGDETPFLMKTAYRIVNTHDETACQSLCDWWETLTQDGGEGLVIKPVNYITHGKKGLIQPAIKCRGREYLRMIYGPEYTQPTNLNRLRERGLSRKRSLALKEFALGLESLNRFVEHAPLRQVHQCVFGVLALESDRIDPRL